MKISAKITAILLCMGVLLCGCKIKEPFPVSEPVTEEPTTELRTDLEVSAVKRIFIPCEAEPEAGLLKTAETASELFEAAGFAVKTAHGKENEAEYGDIILKADESLQDEGYSVNITPYNIIVEFAPGADSAYYGGKSFNGALYGLQSVLKTLVRCEYRVLQPDTYSDAPETAERVLMLDCARKYWTVDWIKNLISEISWMGFNALELHITDEQGIRFNIWQDKGGKTVEDYNGNDFSYVCGGTKVSWNTDYAEDKDAVYNRDEIKEIVEFAKSRHIEIIPSVDLPGHSTNLISRCNDKLEKDGELSVFYNGEQLMTNGATNIYAEGSSKQTINLASEFSRGLSLALAQGYAAFFKEFGCTKFNIGADEVTVSDSGWSEYALKNGGNTQFDAFIIYINSLCDMLKKQGYTVRAFNDYLYSRESNVELDPDLEICWWSSDPDVTPEDAAKDGRKIYNCIENCCYYALRESPSGQDARDKRCTKWSFNHSTAERIYQGCGDEDCEDKGGWNPTRFWEYDYDSPAGAYFLIWADWAKFDTEENMITRDDDYCLIDRMWSSIEKMWHHSADEKMSYDDYAMSIEKYRMFPGNTIETVEKTTEETAEETDT